MEHILSVKNRAEWRLWLEQNFQTMKEVWLVCPKKASGIASVSYNDAVEEALCFGWIDSIKKSYDAHSTVQRYSVRNPKSSYSQLNKERIMWLHNHKMIHPSVVPAIQFILEEAYIYPADIMNELQKDEELWNNYSKCSESYNRIRITHIDSVRDRPDEFSKRLLHFLKITKENKQVKAHGGAEKYY